MSTTTSEEGATAQPQTNEAGSEDGALAVTTDEHGTPTLAPVESEQQSEQSEEKPQEQESTSTEQATAAEDAQAGNSDAEIVEWAKKKGLEVNPENPNEVKLARMQLENDRRFHQAQQDKPKVIPPEPVELTDNKQMNDVIQRQNEAELKMYVRDWFDANPDMKDHRTELMQIAQQRPWLADMDDVAAHFYASPQARNQAKQDGGRQALENLAQKQAAVPPKTSSSNPREFASDSQITPNNVYDLIEKNDQEWFEKNYNTIVRAQQGKS